MTVQEAKKLTSQLNEEISNGIDVKFNTEWRNMLNKRICEASIKGYEKALKKLG